MNRPILKASDVEALTYIYSADTTSPPAEPADLRRIRSPDIRVQSTPASHQELKAWQRLGASTYGP